MEQHRLRLVLLVMSQRHQAGIDFPRHLGEKSVALPPERFLMSHTAMVSESVSRNVTNVQLDA